MSPAERIVEAQKGSTHKRIQHIPAEIIPQPDVFVEHPGSSQNRIDCLIKAIHKLNALPERPTSDLVDW
ncbi:MAG: hypothetical protein JWO07_94 [Candidatus Saccharibacteria bacterium]|nr:hypothetical protein [Candidatus Saccharibacteria bacterium]